MPNEHSAIFAGTDQDLSIRCQCNLMDASCMPLERGTQPSGVGVPQADRSVDAATGNEATVLAYRYTAYRASVAQKRNKLSPAYGIPRSHSLVFAPLTTSRPPPLRAT